MTTARQRGLSLAEVLVAVTVMAIAGTVALFLYDAARKSFKKGENATEQQQALRIAFDMVSTDVRLAGFNANPDGQLDDPDDALEAAYETALVLRADYDAEDGAEATNPEWSLAGAAHRAVAIGNDEIVAYVLAKDDGSSPDTLEFEADVKDVPRDGIPETVRIPNVALVQDDPPYTLYRVTLADAGAWGGASFVTKTPLLENVRTLRFAYGGANGDLTAAARAAGGADTPQARRTRGSIRRIEVVLEGLTRDPDLTWQDPADANPATRSYRKFELRGTITPRNLGRRGMQDLGWDLTPPAPPAAPTLVNGHCRGLYVTWPENPESDGVAAYLVHWTPPGTSRTIASNSFYIDGLADAGDYGVTVQAVDASGNRSLFSEEARARTENRNTPKAPTGVTATTDRDDGVRLIWTPVTENNGSDPTADPLSPTIRDLEGYALWRGPNDSYVRSDPGSGAIEIADETVVKAPTYQDVDVVACRDYYYQVIAYDYCDRNDDTGAHTRGSSVASAPPAAPGDPRAVRKTGSTIRVVWEPSFRDLGGHATLVEKYDVYRATSISGVVPTCGDAVLVTQVADTAFQEDFTAPAGYDIRYWIKARNDCSPPNGTSACSSAALVPALCTFAGTMTIPQPATTAVGMSVPVVAQVVGGSGPYAAFSFEFRNESTGASFPVSVPGAGPTWSFTWHPPGVGRYLIKASVSDSTRNCTTFATKRVTVRP